jgi:hypothetical protein
MVVFADNVVIDRFVLTKLPENKTVDNIFFECTSLASKVIVYVLSVPSTPSATSTITSSNITVSSVRRWLVDRCPSAYRCRPLV